MFSESETWEFIFYFSVLGIVLDKESETKLIFRLTVVEVMKTKSF